MRRVIRFSQADRTSPTDSTIALGHALAHQKARRPASRIARQSMTIELTSRTEFRVNTTALNDQEAPSIATLADGSYVVVWQSFDPRLVTDSRFPNGWDIYLQ